MYIYYRSIRSDRPTCIFNAKAGTRRWDAAQVSLDIPLSFYPLSSSSNDNFLAALNQANLEFAIFCQNLIARSQI